jgi:hypothetical protein
MATNEPNPQSAKEPAEGSRENVAPDAKRATDAAQSGHQHGDKNTEQTLEHPGREQKP